MSGFKVQKKMCTSCIYRSSSPLDIKELEEQVRDRYGGFDTHRSCHHAPDSVGVCCRGFWDAHKDEFQAGQLAQRLDAVDFVDIDIFAEDGNGKEN
jgi:hypothetical protein